MPDYSGLLELLCLCLFSKLLVRQQQIRSTCFAMTGATRAEWVVGHHQSRAPLELPGTVNDAAKQVERSCVETNMLFLINEKWWSTVHCFDIVTVAYRILKYNIFFVFTYIVFFIFHCFSLTKICFSLYFINKNMCFLSSHMHKKLFFLMFKVIIF